jgi:hypothetical protein
MDMVRTNPMDLQSVPPPTTTTSPTFKRLDRDARGKKEAIISSQMKTIVTNKGGKCEPTLISLKNNARYSIPRAGSMIHCFKVAMRFCCLHAYVLPFVLTTRTTTTTTLPLEDCEKK